jgi:hypothetical protein
MASTIAPATPDQTPRNAQTGLNRSFTLPTRLAASATPASPSEAEIGAADGIETLYVHPAAKVVKFAASAGRSGSKNVGPDRPEAGILPWATSTERTIANGPLEIYRVPGSVSFIHSGSLLHAVMPRSQCWCVDGKSKFAMRVALPDTYYRIELPGETEEDIAKVAEFEDILRKVLFYERTACPFARGFSVDLPPEEPVVRQRRRKSHGPAKKWRLARAYSWKPEDGEEPPSLGDEEDYTSDVESDGEPAHSYDSSLDETQSDASGPSEDVREFVNRTPTRPSVRERIAGLTALRSVTSPPQFGAQRTPPRRLQAVAEVNGSQSAPATTSFQDIPTAMPPSPPDSSAGFESAVPLHSEYEDRGHETLPKELSHINRDSDSSLVDPDGHDTGLVSYDKVEVAEQPIVPETSGRHILGESTHNEPSSQANPLAIDIVETESKSPVATITTEKALVQDDDASPMALAPSPGIVQKTASSVYQTSEDPYAQIRARIQARRSIGGGSTVNSPARMLSSMSSRASLVSTSSPASRHAQAQQQALTSGLMQKAVTKFLGPPAALVAIMLRIADRFANGAYAVDFGFYRTPEGAARRVPGSFDLEGSDVEDLGFDSDDTWNAGDGSQAATPEPGPLAMPIEPRPRDGVTGNVNDQD